MSYYHALRLSDTLKDNHHARYAYRELQRIKERHLVVCSATYYIHSSRRATGGHSVSTVSKTNYKHMIA